MKKRTIVGLVVVSIGALFIACWQTVLYVIIALDVLFEFLGQSINSSTDRHYYGIGETVKCEITYHVSLGDKYIRVEIIDDVTDLPVADTFVYPLIHGGYPTIHYDSYVTQYPGWFRCHAQICDVGAKSMGWQGSTCYFTVGDITPQYPNDLELWCGDNIKGNPNEKLSPYDFTAHYVAVQVVGTDHEAKVHFSSDVGIFEDERQKSIEKSQHAETINGQAIYIAHTWIYLPNDAIVGAYPYLIEASQEEAPNKVEFVVYGITDGEKSHDIDPETHQTNSLGEVGGDNYLDNGLSADYKDVKVELDYYLWQGADTSTIQNICGYVKYILQRSLTEGDSMMRVTITLGDSIKGGTGPGQMPQYPDRQKRMELLAYHKGPLTDRIWNNSIHVILGSSWTDPDTMGSTDMYPETGTVNLWELRHKGSGGIEYSQPFLDSVGCFVFALNVCNKNAGPFMSDEQAIALVTAHEIGHALGMWHYPDAGPPYYLGNHVMVKNVYMAFNTQDGFNKYGKFSYKTLDGNYDLDGYVTDGMNTRHVLGIDCVQSIRE